MPDHVVDTNVLLVASAADPFSPFGESHVPADERRVVHDWLAAFRRDSRALVIDQDWKIYEEYQRKLTGQDLGLLVVHDKLQRSQLRTVAVAYQRDGQTAIVPEDFRPLAGSRGE